MKQALTFIASCYSVKDVNKMKEARLKLWNRRTMKKTAKKALPLVHFRQLKQTLRKMLRGLTWNPPNVDQTEYG